MIQLRERILDMTDDFRYAWLPIEDEDFEVDRID